MQFQMVLKCTESQRLKCKQVIRLTFSPSGLMGFVLYFQFSAHTDSSGEDIIANIMLV